MKRKAIWRSEDARFYNDQPLCFGNHNNSANRQIEKDKLEKLIKDGNTLWQIIEILKISKTALFRRLKKYDIKTPSKGFYMTGVKIGRPKMIKL